METSVGVVKYHLFSQVTRLVFVTARNARFTLSLSFPRPPRTIFNAFGPPLIVVSRPSSAAKKKKKPLTKTTLQMTMTRVKPSQMMNWRGLSRKTTMIRLKIVARSRMRAVTILVRRQKRGETKERKPQLTMINYKFCTSMTLECMKYSDLYRIHVIFTSWQTLWDTEMFELVPSKKKMVRCFFSFFFCMCAPFYDVTSTPFVPRDMRTPLTHRDCNGNLWVFTKWHNIKDWKDYKQCPHKLQQLTGALIGVLDQRRSQRFFVLFKLTKAVESVLLTHYLVNLTTSTFTVTKRCSRNPNYWNIRKIS